MSKNTEFSLVTLFGVILLAALQFIVSAGAWAALFELVTIIIRDGIHLDLKTFVSLGAIGLLFRFVVIAAVQDATKDTTKK